jgi:hypothetical protein
MLTACYWLQVGVEDFLPLLALADQYDVHQLHEACMDALGYYTTNHRYEAG